MNSESLKSYLGDRMGLDTASLADETPLFSSNLLDSFSMVDLIMFIEKESGVRLNPDGRQPRQPRFDRPDPALRRRAARRGVMAERHDVLADVAQRFGTPCFIYFLDDVRARLDAIRQAFGGRFEVSYAVKSNPNPALVAWMKDHVPALDISSGGELRRALAAGWSGDRISFHGPRQAPVGARGRGVGRRRQAGAGIGA